MSQTRHGRTMTMMIMLFVVTNLVGVLSALPPPMTTMNDCKPSICSADVNATTKLRYEQGKSYLYDFDFESTTKIVDAPDESSELRVKGQLVLTGLSACDLLLTIRRVSVETGRSTSPIDPLLLEGPSIRFGYHNGEIGDVCVSQDDAPWSINFKRALLSSFQNLAVKNPSPPEGEQFSLMESDFLGLCKINYTLSGNTYTKIRKLRSCNNREGGSTLTYGVRYSAPNSDQQNIPDLGSTLTCNQTVDKLIFSKIACEEPNDESLFFQSNRTLQIRVKTSLNLISIENSSNYSSSNKMKSDPEFFKFSSILFDHDPMNPNEDPGRQKMATTTSLNLLHTMCSEIEISDDPKNDPTVVGVVSSKLPSNYLQLKRSLGSTSLSQLQLILGQIQTGQICPKKKSKGSKKLEKLFLDACAMSATDGCIQLLSKLYAEDALPWATKYSYHSHVPFALRPGPMAVEAVAELLASQKEAELDLLLAASGLAHRYCKEANRFCYQDDDGYVRLANLVGRGALKDCSLTSLESLGNLDVLTKENVQAVLQCLDYGDGNGESIVSQALDAFRGHPCQPQLREKAREILTGKNNSDLIRIKSYLTLTKCLQVDDVWVFKEVILNEKSKQVTSFIASHIKNILKAEGPGTDVPKLILRDLEEFLPIDLLTTKNWQERSENVQYSHFHEDDNVGFLLDLNRVLAEGSSSVPKMLSLNLTFHVAGRSFNLIEAGLYLANFESIVDSYLGPLALMMAVESKNSVNEIISDYNKAEDCNNVDRLFSEKLSIDSYEEFDKFYGKNEISTTATIPAKKESSHWYLRIFGTTIIFDQAKLDDWSLSSASTSSFNFLNKLLNQEPDQTETTEGVKGHNINKKIDIIHPYMVLDEELKWATISGFPLNLNLEAGSIFSMHVKGHSEIGQFFTQSDKGMKEVLPVKAKFGYGAASLFKARLTIGDGVMENGIQAETKFYSTAAIHGQVKRQKGQLDVRVNVPSVETPLLDGRHGVYWIEEAGGEAGLENKFEVKYMDQGPKTETHDCDLTPLTPFLGPLKACATFKIPKQNFGKNFPFDPSTSVSVTLVKTDPKMEGYHWQIKSQLEDENEKSFSTSFDIPGVSPVGSHKREIKWTYRRKPNVKMELEIDEPGYKYGAFYENVQTDFLKSHNFWIGPNKKMHGLKIQWKISRSDQKHGGLIYEPLIQYRCPCGSIQNYVEGKVSGIQENLKDVHIDLKLNGGSQFGSMQGKIVADIQVRSHRLEEDDRLAFESLQRDYPTWTFSQVMNKNLDKNDLKTIEDTYAVEAHLNFGPAGFGPGFSIESKVSQILARKIGLMTKIKSLPPARLFSFASGPSFDLEVNWLGRIDKMTDAFVHKFDLVQRLDHKNFVRVTQNNLWDIKLCKERNGSCQLFNSFRLLMPPSDLDFSLKADSVRIGEESEVLDFKIESSPDHEAAFKIETGPKISPLLYDLQAKVKYPGQSVECLESVQKTGNQEWRHDTKFLVTPGPQMVAITDVVMRSGENGENSISSTITSPDFTSPMIFKAGLIQNSGQTSAHLVLESDGSRQVDILTEFNRRNDPDNPNLINGKAVILSYLNASLSGSQMMDHTNLKLTGNWLPTDQDFVGESVVNLEKNIYNLDGQLTWNESPDEEKKSKNFDASSEESEEKGKSLSIEESPNFHPSTVKVTFRGNFPSDFLNGSHHLSVNYGADRNQLGLRMTNVMETVDDQIVSKLKLNVEPLPYELNWENRVGTAAILDPSQFGILSNLRVNMGPLPLIHALAQINNSVDDKGPLKNGPEVTRIYDGLLKLDGLFVGAPTQYGYNVEWTPTKLVNGVIRSRQGTKQASSVQLGAKLDQWDTCQSIELGYKMMEPSSNLRSVKGVLNVTVPSFYF